jgi:hypothetical protein
MDCKNIVDRIIEADGDESVSLFRQLVFEFHLLTCSRCSRELRRYRLGRELLASSCQGPESPGLEVPGLSASIMAAILAGSGEASGPGDATAEVLSFRRWVVAGCIIMISLVSVFFCLDFLELSASTGFSLMVPMSLTIGIFISAYGALFIGSHLKELSQRFRLR